MYKRQNWEKSHEIDYCYPVGESRNGSSPIFLFDPILDDELESKGGDTAELRLYSDAVSGINIAFGDTETAWLVISAWLKSDEGGILMLVSLIKFIIFLCFVWFLAKIAGRLADRLTQHSSVSVHLENFIKIAVRRTILFIGFIVSLAILGINITPVLAFIGAVGLVVGLSLIHI